MMLPNSRDGQGNRLRFDANDYAAPGYWIETVDLTFDLDPAKTRVLNRMRLRRNPEAPIQPLRLDGDELNLARVLVNGQGASFRMEGEQLVIDGLPYAEEGDFELEIFTTCCPIKNTKLMGLFVSEDTFFTQCEAEGFRRITYFLDRPDVMADLHGDLARRQGPLPGAAVQREPARAGRSRQWPPQRQVGRPLPQAQLPVRAGGRRPGGARAEDRDALRQGAPAAGVRAPRRPGKDRTRDELAHCLGAWDEARFKLPLDLERFMIVGVSDFNMGAMENKGLNIFNTSALLVSPATATDADFNRIEAIVAHEYFHNWTGDRVTCRDWFQLSPEGRPHRLPRPGIQQDMCGRCPRPAPSSASRTCAPCARCSSPRIRAPWRIRCGPTAMSRSTISTRPPSTKKAPKWSA
jgi:aminopeptidase N